MNSSLFANLQPSDKKKPKLDSSFRTSFEKFTFTHEWSIQDFHVIYPSMKGNLESPLFTSVHAVDLHWQLVIHPYTDSRAHNLSVSVKGILPTTERARLCTDPTVRYTLSTVFPSKNRSLLTSQTKTSKAELMKTATEKVELCRLCDILNYSFNDEFAIRCEITVWRTDKPVHSDWHTCATVQPSENVAELMDTLLRRKDHTDFTIVAEGKEFKTHKCMLSASSNVFKTMLETQMTEAIDNRTDIPDITVETLEAMLEFIYTGHVEEMDRDMAAELLAVAEKYDMQSMKISCSTELHHRLDTSNIVDTLRLARQYRSEELEETCIKFIANHRKTIQLAAPDDWKQLKEDFDVLFD